MIIIRHTYVRSSSCSGVNSHNDTILELEGQCSCAMVKVDLHVAILSSEACQVLGNLRKTVKVTVGPLMTEHSRGWIKTLSLLYFIICISWYY